MLDAFWGWLLFELLRLDEDAGYAQALQLFVHDSVKILLLLWVMILMIGFARTWLPESTLRRYLHKSGFLPYLIAALFGALTPFCSCSSVPIFIALLKAGVPLGVTFAFMTTSPLINQYLVILMMAEFGLPITVAYVSSGMAIGIGTGLVIGRLGLERFLERDIATTVKALPEDVEHSLKTRFYAGYAEAMMILKQIWIWVLIGIGIGALIHNFVPETMIHDVVERTGVMAVPLATLLGVPLYGGCAAIVPVAAVLFSKGIPLGTALAFMMSMAALSLPEAIMVRRVMKLALIGIYFGITAFAIVVTGYLINALAPMLVP
ncbi:MAG: permease [Verrucomicrobia bacterium]|nr:permease [Verrucomicrobiota bacterium]